MSQQYRLQSFVPDDKLHPHYRDKKYGRNIFKPLRECKEESWFKDIIKAHGSYDRYNNEKKHREIYGKKQHENIIEGIQVIKRPFHEGRKQAFDKSKIAKKLNRLLDIEPKVILKQSDILEIIDESIPLLVDGMTTEKVDDIIYKKCTFSMRKDPEFGKLAVRIMLSNWHQNVSTSFIEVCRKQYESKSPTIRKDVWKFIRKNPWLESIVDHGKDFSYFVEPLQLNSLMNNYLRKVDGKFYDLPQFIFMRVAVEYGYKLDSKKFDIQNEIRTLYNLISSKCIMPASPTLFNACSPLGQLASCFIIGNTPDSIPGISNLNSYISDVSKGNGGIGAFLGHLRTQGSVIRGTNAQSQGFVYWCKQLEANGRAVNQGGKRNAAISGYIPDWYYEIETMSEFRLKEDESETKGSQSHRVRDLFTGVCFHNLFFERVQQDGNWTLFCPDSVPGLIYAFGEEFEKLYVKYENDPSITMKKIVKARYLYDKIFCDAKIESGLPYAINTDNMSIVSNQLNLGPILCSNLCTEIAETMDYDEIPQCTLASIPLPSFVDSSRQFDYEKFGYVVERTTRMLNTFIDRNRPPMCGEDWQDFIAPDNITPEELFKNFENFKLYRNRILDSAFKHRPIGMGIQGYKDILFLMKIPFESDKALELSRKIAEHMYYHFLKASHELALEEGHYWSFENSSLSRGELQFDKWGVQPSEFMKPKFDALREKIKKDGVRNSLGIAKMPTKTSSHITGFGECFEPLISNYYTMCIMESNTPTINRYLVNDLKELKLWNEDISDEIVANRGSVQNIKSIPDNIKEIYKTAWEISQKAVIDTAAITTPFVDQSQSMNLFVPDTDYDRLRALFMYAATVPIGKLKGLITICYYLHQLSGEIPFQITVKKRKRSEEKIENDLPQHVDKIQAIDYEESNDIQLVCSLKDKEGNCNGCGS